MPASPVPQRARPFLRFLPVLTTLAVTIGAPAAARAASSAPTAAPSAAVPSAVVPPTAAEKKDGPDPWNVATAIATIFATVIAAYSARQSAVAAKESEAAARQSERAARATHLATLWNDIESLTYLSTDELQHLDQPAVAAKVRRNVNRLEKIAFHWSTDLVDRPTLELELGQGAALLYEQIRSLGPLAPLNRTGPELLGENPLIPGLYAALRKRFPAGS